MRFFGRHGLAVLFAAVVAGRLFPAAAQGSADGVGTFTDKRDGKTYKTAAVGGKRWMGENLNYGTSSGSWCYKGDNSNCVKYGRLYDWETAKTVCPAGYHLPSRQEWVDLAKAAGGTGDYGSGGTAGKKLNARSGWNDNKGRSGNGTDEYGFSALPGGGRRSDGYFYGAGNYGDWWTATESGSDYAYSRGMVYNNDYVNEGSDAKDYGLSVRCIKNDD